MIGRLKGTIIDCWQSPILIDVRDVGYEVHVSSRTLGKVSVGSDATLLTAHVVRENASEIFGFLTPEEKTMFLLLCKVPKIGARTAMSVLGVLDPGEVLQAIQNGDAAMLTRVPGIGRKTAERVLVELRDLAADFGVSIAQSGSLGAAREAVEGLVALGFPRAQADREVAKVYETNPDAELSDVIRRVLQGA